MSVINLSNDIGRDRKQVITDDKVTYVAESCNYTNSVQSTLDRFRSASRL